MVLNMRVNGKMIFSMVREWKLGQMVHAMRETTPMVESMELVLINGMMDLNILVIGLKIRSVGLVSTHGLMAVNTKVNGTTTIWKAWVYTYGTMVVSTKGNIEMIKSTVLVFILGLMVVDMRDTGSRGNSMV